MQRIADLTAQLQKAHARIATLEAQLGRNSTNSSQPPASDAPWQPGRLPPRKRKRTRRKRGGQPGHKRHERAPVPPEQVSAVIPVKPTQCRRCRGRLQGEDRDPYRHQVTELPPIQAHVTEYRFHRLRCAQCGIVTRAPWPDGVPQGQFGPRLQAAVTLASGLYRLPKRVIEAMFGDLFGIPLSVGSVCKLQHRTSEALAHPVAELKAAIPHEPVVHADETGWKEAGQKMWLWLAATTQIALFLIRPGRTRAVAQELLGAFAGTLVTDRFPSYGFVDVSQRQVCWAHLLRDIEAFRLWGLGGKRLATAIQRPARRLLALFHQVRDGTLSRASFRQQAGPLEREILYHLRRGKDWRVPAVAGTCRKILELEAALFSFVHHDDVPPTNNHAERILRHAVVWRKISAGTNSARGSRFVERILSAVITLRLQGRNVLDYLTEVCTAALHGTQPPSLLPHARASPCALAA